VAERFSSGGSKADAVEIRDCSPGRRGHADELAVPVRVQRHVARAAWPASLLDEPVPAVEFGNLRQQPVADLGVQCRLDPSAGLCVPSVQAVHRERKRHGYLVARLAGHAAHQGVEDRLVVAGVHAPGRFGREPREQVVGAGDIAAREVALQRSPKRSCPGQVPAIQHALEVYARAADEDRQGVLGRSQ
jgi:hypothetical protein